MRRISVLIILILCAVFWGSSLAQDAPPVGYLDSCEANPRMFELFGPHCLNPVTWSIDGFVPVGNFIFYVLPDGTTDAAQVTGYTWDYFEQRYYYYVMVQAPHLGFGGAFDRIAPEVVLP